MTRKLTWPAGAGLVTMALASTPAFAEGTQAGTIITNNVTVDYKVGGINQTQVSASNKFTVDRKVSLLVAEASPTGTTVVSPGEKSAVTTFTVTNSSNATLDIGLLADNRVNGNVIHGGSDTFDVTNIKMYIDSGTTPNGVYDSSDQLITDHLDQISADTTVKVFVVADIPLDKSSTDYAGVTLTATARDGSTSGSLGAVLVQTNGADTPDAVDTVFADTDANGNIARDGISFAEDDYKVSSARITAQKLSRVISDPLNGTTNPKNVPGATVQYCIVLTNADTAAATNVVVGDVLPAEVELVSSSILVDGTYTSSTCNADGKTAGGAYDATTRKVTGTIPLLSPSAARTVVFQATIK